MERPLKIRLHVVSPLHIGCDDVYEPTSFVIDEGKKKLVTFDPLDFIKSLSTHERERFASICMQGTIGSILNIYKFLSNRNVAGREVDIPDDFIKHFKKVKDLPARDEQEVKKGLNKFTIYRTAYNPNTDLPYIPGSSLKGALRTSYLSYLAKEEKIENCWNMYLTQNELRTDNDKYLFIGKKNIAKRLERELLHGDFDTDPFRMVKVSDLMPVGDVKTKIVYAVNKKKKLSEFRAKGLPQIFETIREGAIFEGFINIQQPEEKARIRSPIAAKEFLMSVSSFFMSAVDKESKIIKEINASPSVVKCINKDFEGQLGKTAFLARLGRHSGAEAVTIEGNRNIKIMQVEGSPPKFSRGATTIWLASETSKPSSNNGLIPFGWAVLELVENDFSWPAQQYKTVKRVEEAVVNKAKDMDVEKKREAEVAKVVKDFKMFCLSPSPENFIAFLKTIAMDDLSDFNKISFKGMEFCINIGIVSKLKDIEIEKDILKPVAVKLLEVITPKKKWNQDKMNNYQKLKEWAGK